MINQSGRKHLMLIRGLALSLLLWGSECFTSPVTTTRTPFFQKSIIQRTSSSTTTLGVLSVPDIDLIHNFPGFSFASSIIESEKDPLQYAFMLPITTAVAVLCQSAGIGGAALLSPILLLIFPLLGPDYPLASAASSIASALLTECFGFMSGLSGFWRRGLVDWTVAFQYLKFSVPACLVGAIVEPSLASQTVVLRSVYAVIMVALCVFLFVSEKPETQAMEECIVDQDSFSCETADGVIYNYLDPDSQSSWKTRTATVGGAAMTGLLGVGMGEVVLPQLVRVAYMPLPVAAGTSVAIVVVTALTAAVLQFLALAQDLSAGSDMTLSAALMQVIPWSLVQFTIPGAILGGQIAPWLASKEVLDEDKVEQVVAALFGVIGVSFGVKCLMG